MEEITVKKTERTDDGDCWGFLVDVGSGEDKTKHLVSLDKDYWQNLTGGEGEPEEFVRRSFEFLLEREPKEQILRQFNIRVIAGYFPEYEKTIKEK